MLAKRRVIGKAHKAITPPDVLERIRRRNLADYGDELGPTIEWFRSKGKSWEDIIESASRPGGADLGFYELRMVWLQQQERYDTFAEFDPISGILREFRRSFWRKPPSVPHGFYSKLQDHFFAVYGLALRLFIAFDKQVIEIAQDQTIQVSGPRSARLTRVLDRLGGTVIEMSYSLDGIEDPIPNDPTPFVEDEDRDIGLFASNISMNAQRRALFTNK